jgi:hypothetical protein
VKLCERIELCCMIYTHQCLCVLCMREIFIFGGGSKYTLCPRGFNHVDSFRIYEALMSGARVVQRADVEGKHCCVWPAIEACSTCHPVLFHFAS